MSKNISEQVKISRKQQGMTIKKLAEKSGVSVGHISEFENGKTTLGGEKLISVCRILGIEFSGTPPMFTEEKERAGPETIHTAAGVLPIDSLDYLEDHEKILVKLLRKKTRKQIDRIILQILDGEDVTAEGEK